MIRLGPFSLLAPIAKGGTSEVWKGRHLAQGVPVAVKVMTARAAQAPEALAMFANEVRSVARLHHPAITAVYEHGEISEEVAAWSSGFLTAGCPYLVMEYASGGTLGDLSGPVPWRAVRAIVLAVLGGLAHAHAHNVVHRDVKPGNVLLFRDPEPSLRLADFGISHVAASHLAPEIWPGTRAGTRRYMAPEQVAHALRDQGPWTDLYGVGCLAWRLATGQLPDGLADNGPGALLDQPTVTDGFTEWVMRLLALEPIDRFQRAADAARALAALPAPPEPGVLGADLLGRVVDRLEGDPDPVRDGVFPGWRSVGVRAPAPPLLGAGLSLFGVRTIPIVGRVEERDTLWGALRRVVASRRGVFAVVRGPTGSGRTRLLGWTAGIADELGVATVLWARLAPDESAEDAVHRMLTRYFGTGGLGTVEIEPRIAARIPLSEEDRELLAAWLAGAGPTDPAERWALVRRVVVTLGAERAVIVSVDDAHQEPGALGALIELAKVEAPVLVLASVDEAVSVQGLADVDVVLGPLPAEDRAELLRTMLGLDDSLAAAVELRSAGNPLFAVQLVGDWVQRGQLESTASGFVLAEGAGATLPDDLFGLWEVALARIGAELPAAALACCERAAVLGQRLRTWEWRAACADLDPNGVVCGVAREHLLGVRLAVPRPQGWAFAHPMFREALLRAAAPRLRAHHQACAAVVRTLADAPGRAQRLGRHLAGAGDHAAACAVLLEAARGLLHTGRLRDAIAIVAEADAALRASRAADADPRWGELWLTQGRVFRLHGNAQESERAIRKAVDGGRLHRWPSLFFALTELGYLRCDALALAETEALVREAEGLDGRPETAEVEARLEELRGQVAWNRRELDDAVVHFQEAARHYGRAGMEIMVAECFRHMAVWFLERGDRARARQLLLRALAAYEAAHFRRGRAACENELGELARLAGDLRTAETHYLASLREYRAIGGRGRVFPAINLGLIRIRVGEWAGAREVLERAQEWVGRFRLAVVGVAVDAGLLACDAHDGRWASWDTRVEAIRAWSGRSFDDVAEVLERAGDVASRAGEGVRAQAAYELSARHWRGVNRVEHAEAVEAKRGRLGRDPSPGA